MEKKKKNKKESKPVAAKNEKSLLKSVLGHISGVTASITLFFAIYIYMIYTGLLSTPQFLNGYPEEFNVRENISSEVLDNANIKYEAWKISNKSNLETTMSISEEELFTMAKLTETHLEVLNIKNNKIILGEKKKFGKSDWKFSVITELSREKNISKIIPKGGYIGKIKIPDMAFNFVSKFSHFDKSLTNHISSAFNKFKYKNRNIRIITEDGEIKLSNKKI